MELGSALSCCSEPETVEECFVFDIFPDAHENENAIMIADYVKHTFMDHLHCRDMCRS